MKNKREFHLALNSSQIGVNESTSRQRFGRRVILIDSESDSDPDFHEATKKTRMEDDVINISHVMAPENDIVTIRDGTDEGGGVSDGFENDTLVNGDVVNGCAERKGKGKMNVNSVPTKLKELLETDLLEGLTVHYIRGQKSAHPSNGITGVVKDSRILCFCDECKGEKLISANQFEIHAGSPNKRPADYIYLDNHRTLRDVLNACKNADLDSYVDVILNTISCTPEENSAFCRTELEASSNRLLCDSSTELSVLVSTIQEPANTDELINSLFEEVPQRNNIDPTPISSSSKRKGKLTRKDSRFHKEVFERDVLPNGAKLACNVNKKITPSQFETRAEYQLWKKPGDSTHETRIEFGSKSNSLTYEKNDLCSNCQATGNLIFCCNGCPRAFHLHCMSLPSIWSGKWYCKFCEGNTHMVETFAEQNPNAFVAGQIPRVDAMEQNSIKHIQLVTDFQDTSCTLCGIQDYRKSGFGPRTVVLCDQCDKEYHVECLREHKMQILKELPKGDWCCSLDCYIINFALDRLLVKGDQKVPNASAKFVKESISEVVSSRDDLDIKWRVLHGKKRYRDELEANTYVLAKAVSIFHEKFAPIFYDGKNQDIIPHLVYGRNVNDTLQLEGMYCAVLSINSTIVATAVFRVFCTEVAEIPLATTSKGCEGKGYFTCLYSCLEEFLKDLGVKNILVPAIEETKSMWRSRFGFADIPPELNRLRTEYPLMNFNGTSMMRKMITL